MATLKNNTLIFSNGRQVKLMGETISIGKELQIGVGYWNHILFYDRDHEAHPDIEAVANVHNLSEEEVVELADLMIALWNKLKENISLYGMKSSNIFDQP